MDKRLGKYAKLYRKALMKQGFSDVEGRTRRFATRLAELYASPQYSEHNVYPTVNVELICSRPTASAGFARSSARRIWSPMPA